MKSFQRLLILFLIMLTGTRVFSQYDKPGDTLPENVLLEKLWCLGAEINSSGWGLKFRKGFNKTYLRQNMFEVEFSTYKSPKEVRIINQFYLDSRSFFYGKLNYLSFMRGGVGQQRVLNQKPYWGGVQLSWIYYGGFSLGVTKPVYLYIIHKVPGYPDTYREEQYDPEKHELYDIYGRGPFLSGLSKINVYPGVYLKTGLDFEYGLKNNQISTLEAGVQFDWSPIPIPIMAYNPKQSYFLTLYIAFLFGKRYN